MRPDVLDVTREDNLVGGEEAFDLQIDMQNTAHIISQLTNLYSDPILAVVREYSTNAYDAHVEAMNFVPIDVSLPNRWGGNFTVRDYGNGLTLDEIREVYSRYGASTKRGTDTANGMLGFGCKSALTYGESFTVRSVKNGKVTLVAVALNDEGVGRMTVMDISESTEASGVKITVPVKNGDHSRFQNTAATFYRTWPTGTVNVDGVPNKFVDDHFQNVTRFGDAYVMQASYDTKAWAIMGNVAYPIEVRDEVAQFKLNGGYNIWIKFDIGTLNFTPSREALHYTAKTVRNLNEKIHAFNRAVDEYVDDKMKGSDCCALEYTSRSGAYDFFRKASVLPTGKFTDLVNTGYYGPTFPIGAGLDSYQGYGGNVRRNPTDRIAVNNFKGSPGNRDRIVVENYPNVGVSRDAHFKAIGVAGISAKSNVIWTSKAISKQFACDKHRTFVYDWAAIKAANAVAPAPRTITPRVKNEYQVIYADGTHGTLNSVDATKDVAYMMAADIRQERFYDDYVHTVPEGAILYRVRQNDLDDFLAAAGGKAKTWVQYRHEYAQKVTSPPAIISEYWASLNTLTGFKKFRGRINDPRFEELYAVEAEAKRYEGIFNTARAMKLNISWGMHSGINRLRKKYPLLTNYGPYSEHELVYINAIYDWKESV